MDTNSDTPIASPARIVYGCMRLAGDGSPAARQRAFAALDSAVDAGIRHFDHADIYGAGASEALFGDWLRANPGMRETLTITSKCGIRPARQDSVQHYDFSPAHIEASVSESLQRLGIESLDILLLHRPDYWLDVATLDAVFDRLRRQGAVTAFGVSNFRASQLSLLHRRLDMTLVRHQIRFSIGHTAPLDNGDLDACMEFGILPQAWSPLGGATDNSDETTLGRELVRQAECYGASPAEMALAWLLVHPTRPEAVIGTLTPARIRAAVNATRIEYAREDWYALLEASRGQPVP